MSQPWADVMTIVLVGVGRIPEIPAPPGMMLGGDPSEQLLDSLAALVVVRTAALLQPKEPFEAV